MYSFQSGFRLPKVYVWTLADSVTLVDLYRFFLVFGAIRAEIRCDSFIGRYALLYFKKKEDAVLAMDKLASAILHGKPFQMMDCHPCTKMSGLVPDTLFIRNLPHQVDDEILEFLFMKYGRILYCKVPRCPPGQSTLCGFVQYESDGPCRAAIEEMNGYEVLGETLHVDFYYVDQQKKIELDSVKPRDGCLQDAADKDRGVVNVLAQHINTVASKGKLLQQIPKADATGAFTDSGPDALPAVGNVLIDASHVADQLASLPLD